jgi:ferredoxin-like protein FixX
VGIYVMDIDNQIKFGHLLLNDRKCRSCGEIKNLIDGFYRTRKDRGPVASSYSYECKECTIMRVISNKIKHKMFGKWEYPDW